VTFGRKLPRRSAYEAFAAAKRRRKKLGGFRAGTNLTPEARKTGSAARKAIANAKAADLAPIIAEIRSTGATSLRAIATA
jgi:hypothetical protein